jgi:nitrate reductase molybdenum cofactor assembly chaperone NarJ/NarW
MTAADSETLDLLAACLEYPGAETAARARSAAERVAGDHADLARALWGLAVWLENSPLAEAEERYTALFDLNPVCTLHVGYQIFGDTYPRGALLAGLAGEMRQAGLSGTGDLPDFLPTVLRLLGRLPDPDSRKTLVEVVLVPALAKMAGALGESRCPWTESLRALPGLLTAIASEVAEETATQGREVSAHA